MIYFYWNLMEPKGIQWSLMEPKLLVERPADET